MALLAEKVALATGASLFLEHFHFENALADSISVGGVHEEQAKLIFAVHFRV